MTKGNPVTKTLVMPASNVLLFFSPFKVDHRTLAFEREMQSALEDAVAAALEDTGEREAQGLNRHQRDTTEIYVNIARR